MGMYVYFSFHFFWDRFSQIFTGMVSSQGILHDVMVHFFST